MIALEPARAEALAAVAGIRRDVRVMLTIVTVASLVYLGAMYVRANQEPDYDAAFDAWEQRELLREAAEHQAPPEA